jgi:hypothetical protein
MLLPDLTPSLSLSCFVGERTRTSYTEDCLYGGLSVYVCLSLFLLGLDQLLFAYQMVFANFYLEIITPSTLCYV